MAFASVALADLQPLKHAFATRVTVNDLVLAATAGGLRRWLEQRDAPLRATRVKVPVSLHTAREGREALGNADSFFFVDLPVAEPDPERRLLAIARDCSARKAAGTHSSSTPCSTSSRPARPRPAGPPCAGR